MLTKDEAGRIAASVNALRPEWAIQGLMALLADERLRLTRSYRDVTLALTAVALDPDSRKPTRVLEDGPWWHTTRLPGSASSHIGYLSDDLCAECGRQREVHGTIPAFSDHEYLARPEHERDVAEYRRAKQEEA